MRGFLFFLWEITKIVIIALVIVLPIRYFLFQPFLVRGQSMVPNLENGDYLIIDQLSYRLREPRRGEMIVFKFPKVPSQRYVKRIIGLPGETIEIRDGKVFVSGKALDEDAYLPDIAFTDNKGFKSLTLADNQYFVMGDNRLASSDSRVWGPLPRQDIIGRVFIRVRPFTVLAKIETPSY